jgi:hypothetical protein
MPCFAPSFPVIFPEMEAGLGDNISSVAKHRERKIRQGFVRVEVSVPKMDAGLVRQIAGILADPARGELARAVLRQSFAVSPQVSLKALLASAPLDGIALERESDTGRDVAF